MWGNHFAHRKKKKKDHQLKASGEQGEGKMKVPACPKPALSLPSCEPLAAVDKGFLEKKKRSKGMFLCLYLVPVLWDLQHRNSRILGNGEPVRIYCIRLFLEDWETERIVPTQAGTTCG